MELVLRRGHIEIWEDTGILFIRYNSRKWSSISKRIIDYAVTASKVLEKERGKVVVVWEEAERLDAQIQKKIWEDYDCWEEMEYLHGYATAKQFINNKKESTEMKLIVKHGDVEFWAKDKETTLVRYDDKTWFTIGEKGMGSMILACPAEVEAERKWVNEAAGQNKGLVASYGLPLIDPCAECEALEATLKQMRDTLCPDPSSVDADKAGKDLSDGHNFGWALNKLKHGQKVTRAGWNGKGMWIAFMPSYDLLAHSSRELGVRVNSYMAKHVGNDKALQTLPYIAMYTAQGKWLPGWLASQTDLLTDDWIVYDA